MAVIDRLLFGVARSRFSARLMNPVWRSRAKGPCLVSVSVADGLPTTRIVERFSRSCSFQLREVVVNYKVKGTRSRGMPRTTWLKNMDNQRKEKGSSIKDAVSQNLGQERRS